MLCEEQLVMWREAPAVVIAWTGIGAGKKEKNDQIPETFRIKNWWDLVWEVRKVKDDDQGSVGEDERESLWEVGGVIAKALWMQEVPLTSRLQ